jgi:prepilin-type N-terminal cleavage/methylation domain-containing protein
MTRLPTKIRSGFSLLELLAVITIIGFLASVIIPRVTLSSNTAKEKTSFHNRSQINLEVESYAFKNRALPTSISDIDTLDVFPGGIPRCPVSGAPYTLNATTSRVQGHLGGGKTGGHP